MIKRIALLAMLIVLAAVTSRGQSITYPPVPPGLPGTVSIDSLGWVYGGHSLKLNIYTGGFTFHTKAQGDFARTAKVVWFGQTDQFNSQSVVLGAQSVITFSYSTKANSRKFGPDDFVIEGWLDVCTQTGSVTLGMACCSFSITNQIPHAQCSAAPPPPAQHFRCITDADETDSLKFDLATGQFTLILDGEFRASGILTAMIDADGFTVLRSPGDDNDVTVLINGDFGEVTLLSHRKLVIVITGTIADCLP